MALGESLPFSGPLSLPLESGEFGQDGWKSSQIYRRMALVPFQVFADCQPWEPGLAGLHAWTAHGDPLPLEATYRPITDSRQIKRCLGKEKNRAAKARCSVPMSFSSFSFQTMKFLWMLSGLWSHMGLALRKPADCWTRSLFS